MAGNKSKLPKPAKEKIPRKKKKSQDLNESIICIEDEESKKLAKTPMTRQRSKELTKTAAKRKISTSSNLLENSSKTQFKIKNENESFSETPIKKIKNETDKINNKPSFAQLLANEIIADMNHHSLDQPIMIVKEKIMLNFNNSCLFTMKQNINHDENNNENDPIISTNEPLQLHSEQYQPIEANQQHDLNNQNQEQSFNESFSRYLDNQIDICNNIKNSSDIEKLLEFSDLIDLNSSNSYSEINNNQANQALPLKINSPNTLDNNVTTTKAEIKDMLKASVLTEIISNANNTDSICQSVESQKIIELERLLKAKDCEIRFLKKLVSHYDAQMEQVIYNKDEEISKRV